MYSVYHLEDGSYKFKGILANKKDDVFVGGSLKTLGWLEADVKLFMYDDLPECEEFFRHYGSINKDEVLFAYEDGTLEMCKVTKEKTTHYGSVDWNSPYILDYYTQEEIDDHFENEAVIQAYYATEENIGTDFDLSTLPKVEVEQYEGEVVTQKQERQVLKTINGELVDLAVVIASEEPAAE